MQQQLIFALLVLCSFLENMSFSLINPFFPPFAIDRGVPQFYVGLIISANPIGAFVASLIIGKILNENQRNRFLLMTSGLAFEAATQYAFALISYIDDATNIIYIGVTIRIVQGIGIQLFMTPFYAYISVLYPDTMEEKISVAEISCGLGFLVGPMIGSAFYALGGYPLPFFVIGTVCLLCSPLLYTILRRSKVYEPIRLDLQGTEDSIATQSEDLEPIGYLKILKHYPSVVYVISQFSVNVMFTFIAPVSADYIIDEYGVSAQYVGFIISICSGSYMLCSLAISQNKRYKVQLVMLGSLITGLSMMVLGPDTTITGLPHRLYVHILGQCFLGVGSAILFIYCIPLLNEFLNTTYPKQEATCAALASAIMNATLSVGDLAGPLAGGLLTNLFGFERACTFAGGFMLLVVGLQLPLALEKSSQ